MANQTQDAFGYSIYKYLGSICGTAVQSGKFSIVFKTLLNSSSSSSSQLIFLNASTSSYSFTILSDAPTKSPTSSTTNSNAATTTTLSFVVIFAIVAGGAVLLVLLLVGYCMGYYEKLCCGGKGSSSTSENDASSSNSNKRGKLKGKVLPTSSSDKYQVSSSSADMEAGFTELYRAPPLDGDETNPMGQQDKINTAQDNDFQFSLIEKPPPTQSGATSSSNLVNVLDETLNETDLTRQKYRVKKKRVISKQAMKIQEALRQDFPTTDNDNYDDVQAEKTVPKNKRKVVKRRL